MFYVYALKSEKFNYIYVGMTNDLERRLSQHNKGFNRSTKPYVPFVRFYSEKFVTRQEARNREKFLKNASGKRFLKTLLTNYSSA